MYLLSLPWNFSRYSMPRSRTLDIFLVDIIPTCVMLLVMAFSMALVTELTSSPPSTTVLLSPSANR